MYMATVLHNLLNEGQFQVVDIDSVVTASWIILALCILTDIQTIATTRGAKPRDESVEPGPG